MSKKDMNDKLLGAVHAGVTSGVGQSDQTPAPSLDHPWENLHPDRIWPD